MDSCEKSQYQVERKYFKPKKGLYEGTRLGNIDY